MGLELFTHFPARIFSLVVIGMMLLIMAGAIPLFLLMPRVRPGFNRQPSGPTRFISGFADRIELGRGGTIQQSDAIVMRVRTDTSPTSLPLDLKWRGLAFDYFDGRSWTRSDQNRYSISSQGRFYKLADSARGTQWIQQTFFIEALSTNVVFAASRALAISRDAGVLQRDSSENLYAARHLNSKLKYTAISDRVDPAPLYIPDFIPIPQEILNTYLQLPAMDPRIARQAKSVTGSITSRYAQARALEEYLRSHYAYSLTLRTTPDGKDPLAMFLFDARAGHCEYFASALTVMLRQIGIPARLINGFRVGEYNSIGNNWTVRKYHAHSWVEAYFPPYGWIEFDSTPIEPASPRTGFGQMLLDLRDAIGLWWWEGIVNYDSPKQYGVLNTLFSAVDRVLNGIENIWASAKEKWRSVATLTHLPFRTPGFVEKWILWMPGLLIAVSILIGPVRIRIFRKARRLLYRNNRRIIASSFYAEALHLLRSHGIKRSRELTPMEFALSLDNQLVSTSFLALTHMYYAARFGYPDRPFSHEEAQSLIRLLRDSLQRGK
jgi:transglutaminase-like putative cysteine protease